MKAYTKRIAATGLCLCMAIGMTGCSDKTLDASKTVATVGEKEMTLGEANFLLRLQQAETESYYESMLGMDNLYAMSFTEGTTYGDTVKDEALDSMHEYYILEAKASEYGVELTEDDYTKIKETADAFMAANDDYVKEQMTADQATVERVLELQAISTKVQIEMNMQVEVDIDEEAAIQRGFTYVYAPKVSETETDADGNLVDLSDDEIQANREMLQGIADAVAAGESIDALGEAAGLTIYTGTYSEDYTSYYDTELIAALEALAVGEVSPVVESDENMFVAVVTTDNDEEATEDRKASMAQAQMQDNYEELMEGWKSEYPLTVKEDVWADVVFDRSYTVKTVTTEE